MIFNIIDIETTGGSFGNRITEVGLVKIEDGKVIGEWQSMVNPEVPIPQFITQLTGITNDMVAHAPTFKEIANELYQQLQDGVFVAHNVGFDYPIVKSHFTNMNVAFNFKKLCTVRLSRKIFPGYDSYSLGKLCKTRNIRIVDHHRALSDAKATAALFLQLEEADEKDFISTSLNRLNREAVIPPNMERSDFEQLPEGVGVYYFLSKEKKVLYVGKAKNIKKRILNHLDGSKKQKAQMIRDTHHIHFEETHSELHAYVLEDLEIKKHFPPYNRAQKLATNPYAIFSYTDRRGIIRLDVARKRQAPNPLMTINNLSESKAFLHEIAETHELCLNYCGVSKSTDGCINSFVGPCKGICKDDEDIESYNERVKIAIEALQEEKTQNMIVFESVHLKGVVSLFHLENGQVVGMGQVSSQEQMTRFDDFLNHISPVKPNPDLMKVMRFYMNKFPERLKAIEQQVAVESE